MQQLLLHAAIVIVLLSVESLLVVCYNSEERQSQQQRRTTRHRRLSQQARTPQEDATIKSLLEENQEKRDAIDELWNHVQYQQYDQGRSDYDAFNRQLTSDQTVCNAILNQFVYDGNSYAESRSECACVRDSEALIETTDIDPVRTKRVIPGTFGVDCEYEYCRQCTLLDDGVTEVCGDMTKNFTFNENINSPMNPKLNEARECVEYASSEGDSTRVCKRTYFDYNVDLACQIQLGEGYYISNCKECEFVTCNNQEHIAFDCSNINGLYAFNPCNYTEEHSQATEAVYSESSEYSAKSNKAATADPSLWFFDPLSHLNSHGEIKFDSCFDASAPSSSIAKATSAPVTTAPATSRPVVTTGEPSTSPVIEATSKPVRVASARNSTSSNHKHQGHNYTSNTSSGKTSSVIRTDNSDAAAATSSCRSITSLRFTRLLSGLSIASILFSMTI